MQKKSSVVQALKEIHKPALHQIILGDFNFPSNENNVLVKYLTKDLELRQVVDHSTHEQGGMIDHIYLSVSYCVSEISAKFNVYSDHMNFTIKLKHVDR